MAGVIALRESRVNAAVGFVLRPQDRNWCRLTHRGRFTGPWANEQKWGVGGGLKAPKLATPRPGDVIGLRELIQIRPDGRPIPFRFAVTKLMPVHEPFDARGSIQHRLNVARD